MLYTTKYSDMLILLHLHFLKIILNCYFFTMNCIYSTTCLENGSPIYISRELEISDPDLGQLLLLHRARVVISNPLNSNNILNTTQEYLTSTYSSNLVELASSQTFINSQSGDVPRHIDLNFVGVATIKTYQSILRSIR